MEVFEDMVAADLLIPGSRQWDRILIDELFLPVDAERILRTPISPGPRRDKLIWHYTKDGCYSVKWGYRLATTIYCERRLEIDGNWRALWRLKAPPTIKDCLWRKTLELELQTLATSPFCF